MEIRFTDGSYTDGGERIMLDPTVYPDWQIGAAAERALPPVEEFRRRTGLLPEELIPYGKTPKLDFLRIMERLKDRPSGKYIEVTAITPRRWERASPPRPWVSSRGWDTWARTWAAACASPPAALP